MIIIVDRFDNKNDLKLFTELKNGDTFLECIEGFPPNNNSIKLKIGNNSFLTLGTSDLTQVYNSEYKVLPVDLEVKIIKYK